MQGTYLKSAITTLHDGRLFTAVRGTHTRYFAVNLGPQASQVSDTALHYSVHITSQIPALFSMGLMWVI